MRRILPRLCVAAPLLLAACVHSNSNNTGPVSDAAPNGTVGASTLNVADAAIAGGDPSMALSVSQSILQNEPNNVDAMVHEGDAYYALGRCPASEAAYQRALQQDPKSSAAETGLGRCLLKTNPASAEAALEAAIQDDPGNADALNDLGIARDLQGNFAGAVDPYQKALVANPALTGAEVNLGLSLALSGNGQAALQYLGPLATGPGATPKIREDYAAALVASGRNQEARDVLAIDLPPEQVDSALQGFAAVIAQGQAAQNDQPAPAPPPTEATVPPSPPVNAAPLSPTPPPTEAMAAPGQPTPLLPAVSAPAAPVSTPAPTPPPAAAPPSDTSDTDTTATTAPAPSSGGDEVQLAALNSNDDAQNAWTRLSTDYPSLFSDKTPDIEQAVVRGHTYFRLRIAGFDSRADAAKFCGEVLAAGKTCTVANF